MRFNNAGKLFKASDIKEETEDETRPHCRAERKALIFWTATRPFSVLYLPYTPMHGWPKNRTRFLIFSQNLLGCLSVFAGQIGGIAISHPWNEWAKNNEPEA